MNRSFYFLCCFLLVSFCSFRTSGGKKPLVSPLGKEVKDFQLKNCSNQLISFSNYKTAKGFIIVFTCNHCPFAKLYTKRLNALNDAFIGKDIPLIAINPMDTTIYEDETLSDMKEKALKENFSFPYLQDSKQLVAKSFYASHTPQAYVIWKENDKWIVKYSGAIDDNGQHPELANSYISNAVNQLLNNQPITKPETVNLGCTINYRK
jgi:peroxiredoxin